MFVKILKGFRSASGVLLAVIVVLLVLILLRLPAPLPRVMFVQSKTSSRSRQMLGHANDSCVWAWKGALPERPITGVTWTHAPGERTETPLNASYMPRTCDSRPGRMEQDLGGEFSETVASLDLLSMGDLLAARARERWVCGNLRVASPRRKKAGRATAAQKRRPSRIRTIGPVEQAIGRIRKVEQA